VFLEDYGDDLNAEAAGLLQRVRKASVRMGCLIDDLLELSRVSRKEIRRELVDVTALAKELLGELRRGDPGRYVEVSIAEGLAVEGDLELLRVVLSNLLDNAWKFTSTRSRARIEVGRERLDGEHVLFVRDNGIGFDMAYVDKLFGPFERLHSEAHYDGTGIGLATVRRIVERHGGSVLAVGEESRGATFYLRV